MNDGIAICYMIGECKVDAICGNTFLHERGQCAIQLLRLEKGKKRFKRVRSETMMF